MVTHPFRARNALLQGDPEGDAEFVGDASGPRSSSPPRGAARRVLADAGERRARQCADGIEGQIAPEFQPDLPADIVEHRRLQAALHEALRHARNAFAAVPSGSPTGNRLPSTCLMTPGATSSAAGYTTQPMTRSQRDVPPISPSGSTLLPGSPRIRPDSDENTNTECRSASAPRRCRARTASAPAGNRLDLMRLHREDDDVLRAGRGVVIGRIDRGNGLLAAVGRHQPNAAATQRLQIRAARDEGHLLAGERKPDPDVTANRADTDDRYLQGRSPTDRKK